MSEDKKRNKWIYDAMVHLAKIHGDSDLAAYEEWAESLAMDYYDCTESWGKFTAEKAVEEDLSYL
jgi:hypothetical protein